MICKYSIGYIRYQSYEKKGGYQETSSVCIKQIRQLVAITSFPETVLWSIGTQTVELDIFETFMEKFMSIEMVIIIVRRDQSCLVR